jgi:Tetracyclin repressor-like, C-terminal domain
LTVWDILERGGARARLGVVQAANQNKIAAIEQAQHDGRVSARWSPDELLLLILSISTMWMFVTPEVMERSASEISARRRTVTEAVRLLVANS